MSDPPPSESRRDELLAAACACRIRDASGTGEVAPMDPLVKGHLLKRLERLERQLREIQTKVMDDDYCANIMTEITSAHGALRGAGRELIRNHLRYCIAIALMFGPREAREMLDDVVDMVHKLGR
jgi:DNA-binding FrmR family transcriptional regulator